jgi:hypothetical protein
VIAGSVDRGTRSFSIPYKPSSAGVSGRRRDCASPAAPQRHAASSAEREHLVPRCDSRHDVGRSHVRLPPAETTDAIVINVRLPTAGTVHDRNRPPVLESGVTVTVTGIKCFTNNNGTSTMNVANGAGTGLLTGAITCTNSWAAGTQSGTTTIASEDFLKFTFVSDGASLQTTWAVTETK